MQAKPTFHGGNTSWIDQGPPASALAKGDGEWPHLGVRRPQGSADLDGIMAMFTLAGKVQHPSQSRLSMFPCVLRLGTALGGV